MILERLVPYIFLTGGFLIGVSIFLYLRLWERGEEGRWDAARPAPDTAAGPPPARRLPRLFLIGFTLCVLTGPLVLWMLVRGGVPVTVAPGAAAPAGAPSSGAGSVGAVLEERLPDAPTLARRHAELLEVIRGLGRPGSGAPARLTIEELAGQTVRLRPRWVRPTAQAALAAAGSLLLLAAGVIVWAHEVRGRGLLLGIGICAISTMILLSTGPDLLAFSLESAAGARAPGPAVERAGGTQALGAPADEGGGAQALGPAPGPGAAQRRGAELELIHVARVGPFPDARHALADTQVQTALAALERLVVPAQEGFFLIVGRVDPRPLGAAARGAYGTDTGLAQARANWVRARLIDLAAGSLVAERVLALPAGPASIGLPGVPALDTGPGGAGGREPPAASPDDRCVDIYAYGVRR